jgi:tight adherence protein B
VVLGSALVVAVLLVAGLPVTSVALVAVVGGAALGSAAVLRSRAAGRRRADTERRVLETCEHLAGELATGQPPGAALDRAAQVWDPLRPVAEAFRVGSDVPAAMREAALAPGAGDLARLAAAWQVAHSTGHGLGDAVDRVTDGLRSARATRRVVQGELASARATARLVGALPLLALAMGSGAGGSPWHFLLATPAGLLCLAAGLAAGLAGLAWIEAIARGVESES